MKPKSTPAFVEAVLDQLVDLTPAEMRLVFDAVRAKYCVRCGNQVPTETCRCWTQ